MSSLRFSLFLFLLNQINCHPSDVGLNPVQMIANHGYNSETHNIVTDDGYILTVYRIPNGKNNTINTQKPPVLLMHGILSCAGEFVAMGPNKSLAYILATSGYDVWLGNARGTNPSRNHTSIDLNTEPGKFFNFTWHEIGIYDVANTIDYILKVNGDSSLHYIGHSQGTTVFFVLLSMKPEYNAKIKLASLMAPVAIIQHYPSVFVQDLAKYSDEIWDLLQKYMIYEVPFIKQLRELVITKCKFYPEIYNDTFCDFIYESQFPKLNKHLLPIILTNCPANAGLKQYVHFGQLVKNGGFRQFNYGKQQNLQVYGTEEPGDYDLSKISAPVALYYAKNDGLVTVEDELAVANMIPNLVVNYLVPDNNFVHRDFGLGEDAVDLVYKKILSEMLLY